MYRINYTGRPTLITPDEVIFHAAIDQNPDARIILQNIIVAEERFIAPALCDEFYEELIGMKNKEITAGNQAAELVLINASLTAAGKQTITNAAIPVGTIINAIEYITNPDYKALWNRFLWKLTAEAVDMMCIVPSWLRHTASGQQKNNPAVIGGNGQNSESGDRKDVQFKMDKAVMDRIDPLLERMKQYICKDATKFPKYCKQCDCETTDGVSLLRKTDIIFGLYEDDDSNCNSCR